MGRGVWSPAGGKKNHKHSSPYFQGTSSSTLSGRHIYYEPPDDFEWDQETALVPNSKTGTGEVIVHRRDTSTIPSPVPNVGCVDFNQTACLSPKGNEPKLDEPASKPDGTARAYTEEEFTSAILARTQPGNSTSTDGSTWFSNLPPQSLPTDECDSSSGNPCQHNDSGISGSLQLHSNSTSEENRTRPCDSLVSQDDPTVTTCEDLCHSASTIASSKVIQDINSTLPEEGSPETMGGPDCECPKDLNPRHSLDSKVDARRNDFSSSPIVERRNKSVLGRLRNFASRSSYSTSEDGHSHSSDYEEQEEDKRTEIRFSRETNARSSSSWAGRVRDLHRDVKRKISRLRNSRGTADEEARESAETHDGVIQPGSSVESIPSGSGSSLQPPTPTSSNRSSTSAGEDDTCPYVGTFIGRARALVDCTPSPYDRDGLAFKKGDLIDIITKHKTGIWIGMVNGKVGHFKFINVEEAHLESKPRHRRRKTTPDWLGIEKQPENLEELLKHLGLQEYMNVLVLNGYDELETFKEIEKEDLDSLGIVNPDHGLKLLRAAEMLHGADQDGEDDEDDDDDTKQSPRDSGCYASHENLIHRETSQRLLHNGLFGGDAEDQDTSHSESGIHSREGQDLSCAMNNLDLSAESSTKSTATTVDSREDVAVVIYNSDSHDERDTSNYNIPPAEELSGNNVPVPAGESISSSAREIQLSETVADSSQEVQVSGNTVSISVDIFDSAATSSSVSFGLPNSFQSSVATNGVRCSPKKSRNKHFHEKHSSSRKRHDNKYNDLSQDSFITRSKYEESIPNSHLDRSSYIYAWASFSRRERSSRRRVQEYDDVVSDPATEPEESPSKHIYRKAKQRKGSLQALIHNPRPPSPTLIGIVMKKLDYEKINLCEEPYTDKTGFCGIPPALVQRYAEELQQKVGDVADALDQIRITSLQQQARRGVPNDFLADSCTVPVIEANYSNLHSWLVSLSLPMYEERFTSCGYRHLNQIAQLSVVDLCDLGIDDPYHQLYLEAAIGALHTRLGRQPSISPPPLPPSVS